VESRDWDIVRESISNREQFRREWFCFRTFVTVSVADHTLDAQAWQAFVDTYFRTLPDSAPATQTMLQERVTRYVNITNMGRTRLRFGSIAETCMEFSRLCCGTKNNEVLVIFADVTSLNFGRDQLLRLKSFKLDRKSFVVTNDGTVIRSM
jgi:hypothetical protein